MLVHTGLLKSSVRIFEKTQTIGSELNGSVSQFNATLGLKSICHNQFHPSGDKKHDPQPYLPRFDSLSHLWQTEPHNLHSAFCGLINCLPLARLSTCQANLRFARTHSMESISRTESPAFLGTDRNSSHGFQRRCMIKLHENLVSTGNLHRYLMEHPAIIWL